MYFYRVRAYSNYGYSDYSNEVKVQPSCVRAGPNPFIPSQGHDKITFWGSGVRNATIRIYNKAGELVKTLEETNGSDTLIWDATNDEGEKLASGVYIYVAENSGERNIGKIAIIK